MMMTPRVTFESELGRDDPFKALLERWLGREFPVLSTGHVEDMMAAVMHEFISTKQYRVGPRPEPESAVMMRAAIRAAIENSAAIPVLIPSAAIKLPFGSRLDLAELSALRVLSCLNERVRRHYAPGLTISVRLEDLTEWTISPDVPDIRTLTDEYIRDFRNLVTVLGYAPWLTLKPESSLVTEDVWADVATRLTAAFEVWIAASEMTPDHAVSGTLKDYGWVGPVSGELRQYLRARYQTLYPHVPDSQHISMMARYLAAILTRRYLRATGAADGEPRLEITFANPLPGAPRYSTRLQYRVAPRCQASLAIPYWAAKGYLTLDADDAPHITLAHHREEITDLVHGQLTLTNPEGIRAELRADYTQAP